YGADESTETREVFHRLGLYSATVVRVQGQDILLTISNRSVETGPMSGLRVRVPAHRAQEVITPSLGVDALISNKEGFIFGALDFKGTRWYIASGANVIDVSQPVEKGYFDVTDY